MKKGAIVAIAQRENVIERGPRAWAAKLESQLVSPMFKKPCKQKPEISVGRARAGLELQRDVKKGSGLWEAEEGKQDRRAGPCRLGAHMGKVSRKGKGA